MLGCCPKWLGVAVLHGHWYKYKVRFILMARPLLWVFCVCNVFMQPVSAGNTGVSLGWMGIRRYLRNLASFAILKLQKTVDTQREAVRAKNTVSQQIKIGCWDLRLWTLEDVYCYWKFISYPSDPQASPHIIVLYGFGLQHRCISFRHRRSRDQWWHR